MKYEDLTPEDQEVWDAAYDEGFDAGMEAYGENNFDWDEGYTDGYNEGVQAEQNRIQYVLNMMFESALNMGQGNKAVQYKHAMDLLRPVQIRDDIEDDF